MKPKSALRGISLYYTLYYSASSIYTYLPKYLEQGARLSVEQIGAVQAIGPLVAFILPFLWGQAADNAKSRNTVWAVVTLGTAVSAFLLPASRQFYYIALLLVCVNIFQTSVSPMGDSVCSEICAAKKWDYGRVRVIAPLGYALFTFLAGAYLSMERADIFIINCSVF